MKPIYAQEIEHRLAKMYEGKHFTVTQYNKSLLLMKPKCS